MQMLRVAMVVVAAACGPASVGTSTSDTAPAISGSVVASWEGGQVTADEVHAAVARLPIGLRDQYASPEGRRDFVDALISQKLLRAEAHRRKLHERDDIQRQVADFEERLTTRALLDEAEKSLGPPTEEELQAYFTAHEAEFRMPLRVRVSRVLATGAPDAATRKRADAFRARLTKGEAVERVARDGQGPERLRDGDLGWITEATDAETTAALSLERAGAISPVIAVPTGFSVLVATAHEPPRAPAFDEVRTQLSARVSATRQRRAFDELVTALRTQAQVQLHSGAVP